MTTDEPPTEKEVEDRSGVTPSGGLNLRADRDVEVSTGRDLIAGDSFVGDKAAGDIIKGDNYSGAQITYQYYGVPESQVEDEEPAPGEPPYKGMQPYTEEDGDIFFGREIETAAMIAHLHDYKFLAMAGASGCGKSSLIRAGMIPALKTGHVLADGGVAPDGSDRWPIHAITPTARPLESLAASLTRDNESVTAAFTLANDMAADTRSLNLMARRLANKAGAERVLIIVDQFEELFTLCDDEVKRQAFIDNLLNAVDETDGSIVLVMGLRVAYVSNCKAYGNLYSLMEAGGGKELGTMAQDKLRESIESAAAVGEWEFEEGLVELLLRDAGFEPAVLPWMSHTMLEIWKRRRGRIMTFSGYAEAGGLRGSIVRKAEALYTQFNDEEKHLARNIYMRLTELGEGTQDSRRRAPLAEIIPPHAPPALLSVLRKLAKARLIVVTKDGMHVAHEAIVRDWRLLHQWVEDNRADLRIQRRLSGDAANWVRLGRDPGALYRGVKLAQASELAGAALEELNEVEQEFLQTSKDVIAREEAAREAARQEQLDTAEELAEARLEQAKQQEKLAAQQKRAAERFRKNARRLGYLLVATLCLTIAAAVAFGFAYVSRQAAEQERRVTRARELATTAASLIGEYPQRSLLMAVEAYGELEEDDPRVAAVEEALRLTLANAGGRSLLGFNQSDNIGSPVSVVATDAEGQWVVAGTENGQIIVWDMNQPDSPPIVQPHDYVGKVLDLTLTPDGEWLFTSLEGGVIYQWDMLNLDFPPIPVVNTVSEAYQLSLDTNGRWLVAGGEDGNLQMWDLDLLADDPQSYDIHDGAIYDLDFSDDGTLLATGSGDAKAKVFEVTTEGLLNVPLAEFELHNEPVFGVGIGPNNRTLVTSGGTPPWIAINSRDAVAFVWDLADVSEPVAELRDHRGHITSATISPNGRWMATSSWDSTSRIYDLDDLENDPYVLRGHEGFVSQVIFSADSKSVITSGGDQVVRQWSLESRDGSLVASPIILSQHESILTEVEISMDSKWAATAGKDGLVVLWALDSADPSLNRHVLSAHLETVHSMTFSPDSRWLVTGGDDAQIFMWDLAADDPAEAPRPLLAHQNEVTALAFDETGQTLISGGHDGQIYVWSMPNLQEERLLFSREDGFIHEVAFNRSSDRRPNGPQWLIASVGAPPELLDLQAQHQLLLWRSDQLSDEPVILSGHEDMINTFVISEDGRWLASGDGGGVIYVWDLDVPRSRPRRLDGYPDGVRRVALSPNGRWLVAGGWSPDLYMWDMMDLSLEPEKLSDHRGWINDVEISADGRWMVSSSHDKTARLWNLDAIDELSEIQGATFESVVLAFHDENVGNVAISSDGAWVVTASDDQTALLWSLEIPKLLDLACRTAGRNLRDDRDEWRRYFNTETYEATCPVAVP